MSSRDLHFFWLPFFFAVSFLTVSVISILFLLFLKESLSPSSCFQNFLFLVFSSYTLLSLTLVFFVLFWVGFIETESDLISFINFRGVSTTIYLSINSAHLFSPLTQITYIHCIPYLTLYFVCILLLLMLHSGCSERSCSSLIFSF